MSLFKDRNVGRMLAGASVVAFIAGAGAVSAFRTRPAAAQAHAAAPPVVVGSMAMPTLAPLVKQVTPGVVNISVEGKVEQTQMAFPDDPFFRRFFNLPDQPMEQKYQAAGSGVIMDAQKGYVLTNNHVIDHADKITVTLTDNRRFDAKVIGRDPDADVAVIQIPAKDLTALKAANSDQLQVGDYVVAIGNPFGLNHTVTAGIVSAVGRSGLDIEGYEDFIQTDASINPGNSGGALVNLNGELVGINTAIVGPSNVGIGFAIPINMAQAIMTQLIKHGKVERGQLGVLVQDVTPDVAQAMHLKESTGALVSSVEPGTPAEKAGIKAGDVIVRMDSADVRDASDLRNRIGLLPVGTEIQLGLIRDKSPVTVHARLVRRSVESQAGSDIDSRLSGVTLGTAPEGSKPAGVVVTDVDAKSNAYAAGLRKGDVITSVDRMTVNSVDELKDVVNDSTGPLLINAQRENTELFLVLR
jgi:Do/DeqQ family serine protease